MSPKKTAYIVERLAVRFMSMVADYERKLAEHRASFGARTEADRLIIEGLRVDLDKVRAIVKEQSDHAKDAQRVVKERDGLLAQVQDQRAEIERLKKPARQHPVKVGEWLKRTSFDHGPNTRIGAIAKVVGFDADGDYQVSINGTVVCWCPSNCTPCDPPEATHITPDGKATAQAAVTPQPGDVVRLVRVPTNDEYPHDSGRWEPNWGGIGDYMRVHYVGSNINGTRVVRAVFGLEWPLSCVEVVKGGDK